MFAARQLAMAISRFHDLKNQQLIGFGKETCPHKSDSVYKFYGRNVTMLVVVDVSYKVGKVLSLYACCIRGCS